MCAILQLLCLKQLPIWSTSIESYLIERAVDLTSVLQLGRRSCDQVVAEEAKVVELRQYLGQTSFAYSSRRSQIYHYIESRSFVEFVTISDRSLTHYICTLSESKKARRVNAL